MKIIIAGGTGFIGQPLVAHFKALGHQIAVISRSNESVNKVYANSVETLLWNTLSTADLSQADVIINLAGANIADKLWNAKRKQELVDSRIRPTQTLARLISQLDKKPVFICASGVSIYPADSQAHDERTTHLAQNTFMGQLAWQWEAATQAAKDAGSRVINMRLGVVLDQSGGMLGKLAKLYQWGLGAQLGDGLQAFPWISLADVIHAIEFVIAQTTFNGPINFVAPEQVNQLTFANTFAQTLKRPCFMKIPGNTLQFLLKDFANELLLTGPIVIPEVLKKLGYQFQFPTLKQLLDSQYSVK